MDDAVLIVCIFGGFVRLGFSRPAARAPVVSIGDVKPYLAGHAELAAMQRALEPGRMSVVETDWRAIVLNGSIQGLRERMTKAWDGAVRNPNLPVKLDQMLGDLDIAGVHVRVSPILAESFPLFCR